jgi:hypothetical protein
MRSCLWARNMVSPLYVLVDCAVTLSVLCSARLLRERNVDFEAQPGFGPGNIVQTIFCGLDMDLDSFVLCIPQVFQLLGDLWPTSRKGIPQAPPAESLAPAPAFARGDWPNGYPDFGACS